MGPSREDVVPCSFEFVHTSCSDGDRGEVRPATESGSSAGQQTSSAGNHPHSESFVLVGPGVMDASAIMEGCCRSLRIVSSVFNEGTIKGSSVLARGCDVVVLVAKLGSGSALPCRRTGMRIPWLIGDCQFCGGLWGGTGSQTRCLL